MSCVFKVVICTHEVLVAQAIAGGIHDIYNPCPAFQVSLPKPLGVRFTRGNDGSAYVVRTDAKLGSIDEQIEVSDAARPWP